MDTWQNNSKIDLEKQRPKNNQDTSQGEYGRRKVALPDYYMTHKAIVIKVVWY